jgi:hypothetical protein
MLSIELIKTMWSWATMIMSYAGLSTSERQPLPSFPKIWSMFHDEQIKFTRNVIIEFNKL